MGSQFIRGAKKATLFPTLYNLENEGSKFKVTVSGTQAKAIYVNLSWSYFTLFLSPLLFFYLF